MGRGGAGGRPRRNPSLTAGLMDLGNKGFLLLPMPAAVLVAGTTLASRPGDLLPGWLVRAGLPLAAVLLAGGSSGSPPRRSSSCSPSG